jgi:hypothetical protein
MAFCENCIHYGICRIHHEFISKDTITFFPHNEGCKQFKNKADFVEVETIKSWLYEMALNNVGCHIEGDFSTACEEIISRLEGLKRYSIEKEGADNG